MPRSTRWSLLLVTAIVVLSWTSLANAQGIVGHSSNQYIQRDFHNGPVGGVGEHNFLFPLPDEEVFDLDYQFFAPAEVGEFGNQRAARTGFFATYERLNLWVSRPNLGPIQFDLERDAPLVPVTIPLDPILWTQQQPLIASESWKFDDTWGNRYEFGFVNNDGNGWTFTHVHLNGPNASDPFRTLELDFNSDNVANDPTNPAFIPDNNQIVSENLYNGARYSNFEMTRTFRMDPLHDGGILEPFFSFRYSNFTDRQQSAHTSIHILAAGSADFSTIILEELNSTFENQMFGGQLGARYITHRGRWRLLSEARTFGMQNWQDFFSRLTTTRVNYTAGVLPAGRVQPPFVQTADGAARSSEFVVGMELRLSAAFEVTRDLSMSFGFDMINFIDGIGRGPDPNFNSEEVYMVGWNFGFSYNH